MNVWVGWIEILSGRWIVYLKCILIIWFYINFWLHYEALWCFLHIFKFCQQVHPRYPKVHGYASTNTKLNANKVWIFPCLVNKHIKMPSSLQVKSCIFMAMNVMFNYLPCAGLHWEVGIFEGPYIKTECWQGSGMWVKW